MKKLLSLLSFYVLLINKTLCTTIETLLPDTQKKLYDLQLNKEVLLIVPISFLKPNQYYKIMTHYMGSLGITFKIEIICDDFHEIDNLNRDMKLNDFSEYDFKTDNNKVPSICGKDYKKDKILLSLTPSSITYQLKDEKSITFNAICEIVTSKLNTDVKPLNILMNKNLYRGLIFALIIVPLVIYIFRHQVRKTLLYIVGEKIDKEK